MLQEFIARYYKSVEISTSLNIVSRKLYVIETDLKRIFYDKLI
jgi:hypothetical protein